MESLSYEDDPLTLQEGRDHCSHLVTWWLVGHLRKLSDIGAQYWSHSDLWTCRGGWSWDSLDKRKSVLVALISAMRSLQSCAHPACPGLAEVGLSAWLLRALSGESIFWGVLMRLVHLMMGWWPVEL